MSLIIKIVEWAEKLENWEQDAVRGVIEKILQAAIYSQALPKGYHLLSFFSDQNPKLVGVDMKMCLFNYGEEKQQ